MKKRSETFIKAFFFALCVLMVSCHQKKETTQTNAIKASVTQDVTYLAEMYADSLLTTMTLEQRAGQCLMPSIFAISDSATVKLYHKYIDDYHIGGIVLLKGNMGAARHLARQGENSPIPLFIAIDAEWGLGMRLEDGSVYPKNGNLPKDVDESGMYDYGRRIAEESRQIGVNMVLGPVIDIVSKNKGIIGTRSFGGDPMIVADYGVAYAKGLESGGVVSVAKHFPGHGSTVVDSHKGVATIYRDITTMDSLDLRPFRDYVNAGLSAVMAGHIQSRALDPEGNPASVSMDMLTSLLRDEMGFHGLILTDAFDMGGAKGFSATDALNAGADIILCPQNIGEEYKNLIKSLHEGTLKVETLNERCRRILFFKYIFLISR